ncbi:hypothetical protein ABIB25_003474 [Nakamurella sp. UYEF19]|uniref:Kelch repeat-containing protein n=1 Tax=Nakamurella sp. UYEF19 TaxID=1756392 RepID=UPI003396FA9A
MFRHPRWSALPDAPIVGRENGASAWTGTAWIIWGGNTMQTSKYFADGASYDPATRAWTTLLTAPIGARSGAVSVWTGTSLFVWGGQDATGGPLEDGALYTPGTRSWIRVATPPNLPRADSSHRLSVQAVWTGSRVALVVVLDGETSAFVRFYDPQTNSWTAETAVRLDPHHHAQLVTSAAIGSSVYLFVYWLDSHPVGNNTTESTFGTDGFTLDGNGQSTSNRLASKAGTVAPRILALGSTSGSNLLFPAGQPYCGFCAGPYRFNLHSVLADPATGTLTELPHGPDDDLSADFLWTGNSLLAYDTSTCTTTPGGRATYPGGASTYDPATRGWRALPSAPLAGAGFSTWTGSALLEWGEMYEPKTANTGKTRFRTSGLELTG